MCHHVNTKCISPMLWNHYTLPEQRGGVGRHSRVVEVWLCRKFISAPSYKMLFQYLINLKMVLPVFYSVHLHWLPGTVSTERIAFQNWSWRKRSISNTPQVLSVPLSVPWTVARPLLMDSVRMPGCLQWSDSGSPDSLRSDPPEHCRPHVPVMPPPWLNASRNWCSEFLLRGLTKALRRVGYAMQLVSDWSDDK